LIRERTISLILLLCFAVIPAHSMVPHHHHSGVISPVPGEPCPGGPHDHDQSHKESRHTPGKESGHTHEEQQPAHCHAFNEISFYKHALPGLSKPSEHPVMFATVFSPRDAACNTLHVTGLIFSHSVPYHSMYCGDPNTLRGPPFIA